ncbi:hypothetical protein [Marinospirillum sp.]|uniref:hypothetical protein n=1 Tax=Marinospirillum sp. TaxID=2183934 RepID=UPI00384C76D5
MIWHLIAAVFCGLAAAGVALLLRKLSGQRLPKWIIPVFAGLGMLSYQVYTEYNWYELKQTQLPEDSVIVSKETKENFWRPWTYVVPLTGAFTLLDTSSLETRSMGDQQVAEFVLYRFERLHVDQVASQAYVLNCSSRELVPLQEDRAMKVEAMRRLSAEDPLHEAVCETQKP